MKNSKTRSFVNHSTRLNLLKSMFLCGFFLTAFNANCQKVKIKNEVATVDGTEYLSIVTKALMSQISMFELESTSEVIFAQFFDYSDPSEVSSGNPQGKVRWIEIKFVTLDLTCEISSRGLKALIKELYVNDIFVNGLLNEEGVKKMVQKYGTSFSDNRPATVIIYNR